MQAMPRQKKRKSKKVLRARPVQKAKTYYQLDYGDQIKQRVRQGAVKALDAAESDPEAFWEGAERVAKGLGHIYAAFQRDPEAKRKVRNAFISALATATKRKLG